MAYYSQGHFVKKKKKMRGERPRVTVRQHCQQESCKTGEGGCFRVKKTMGSNRELMHVIGENDRNAEDEM